MRDMTIAVMVRIPNWVKDIVDATLDELGDEFTQSEIFRACFLVGFAMIFYNELSDEQFNECLSKSQKVIEEINPNLLSEE